MRGKVGREYNLDEAASYFFSEKVTFEFIEDEFLRQIIADEFGNVKQCILKKLHKPAVMLAVSIIEALLIYHLSKNMEDSELTYWEEYLKKYNKGSEKPPVIDRWDLGKLIMVAFKRNIIGSTLKNRLFMVKDVRNAIHLYKQYHDGIIIDEVCVRDSQIALSHLIESISGLTV